MEPVKGPIELTGDCIGGKKKNRSAAGAQVSADVLQNGRCAGNKLEHAGGHHKIERPSQSYGGDIAVHGLDAGLSNLPQHLRRLIDSDHGITSRFEEPRGVKAGTAPEIEKRLSWRCTRELPDGVCLPPTLGSPEPALRRPIIASGLALEIAANRSRHSKIL